MKDKNKVLVLGMARSGYEASKFLVSKGFDVILNDARAEQNEEHVKELENLGVTIILGSHPDNLIDESFNMIVKNPGVPNNHQYVLKALELNIPVINEVELAYRYFPEDITIVGVTGTNGKTTTTTLIYEMISSSSKRAHLMGNIGYPVCSFLPIIKNGDIAVMEISDHQLCNVIDFKTNISVLTNLSEAHIDFHGSYGAYKTVKKRIFNHHTKSDTAILNLDNDEVLELTSDIVSSKIYFSSHKENNNGCSIIDNYLCYDNEKIITIDDIKIKGMHNYENAMAAVVVCKKLGISNDVIANVLKTFGGVEHRIEYVRTLNDREFYNDSKATNIKSTQIALSSFKKPTILLMGGLDRRHSFEDLREYLKNVKLIVSYGETKDRIKSFASGCGIDCKVTDTLEEATKEAYNLSNTGDVVLLSPACASWDQFKDFEVRGNMFKEYVNNL